MVGGRQMDRVPLNARRRASDLRDRGGRGESPQGYQRSRRRRRIHLVAGRQDARVHDRRYPECGKFKCVGKGGEAEEKSKVKAGNADRLLYRHWDSFKRGKRSHLFIVPSEGGEPKDLTPGDYDVPPFSLGDPTAFDFAPDSSEVVFARNTDKVEATSTNNDLFIVSVGG